MASAILTVLYPEEFTVYDIRACEQLGGGHEKAGNTSKFEQMWRGYLELANDIKEGFMRMNDLTPPEVADLLARAYAADHGEPEDTLGPAERTALADFLGCHEEVRAAAFAVWCQELGGVTEDEATYWLDVEFVEPCHEQRLV